MEMPKATLRKDGRWMIALPRKSGEPRRYVYGRSPDEATRKFNVALGIGTVKVRPGSISEFAVLDFAEWDAARVSALSTERYDVCWRHQLGPAIGHYRFHELTPKIVQDALKKCGSPSTQELSKSLLSKMVKYAIALGKCATEVRMMVELAQTDPRTPKERIDIQAKANQVLDRAKGGPWEGVIWLQKQLGLRWGEICGLKITDLNGDTLTIQRQRNNKVGEVPYTKKRKPGEHRVIGLPKWMAAKLRGYMNGSLYAFHGPDGEPIDYCHNDRKLKPYLKGIGAFTMHDLRSAAICELFGRVDEKTYFNLFGHTAIQQTREYLDSSEDQTREALQIVVEA